jgi:hypothetical protein
MRFAVWKQARKHRQRRRSELGSTCAWSCVFGQGCVLASKHTIAFSDCTPCDNTAGLHNHIFSAGAVHDVQGCCYIGSAIFSMDKSQQDYMNISCREHNWFKRTVYFVPVLWNKTYPKWHNQRSTRRDKRSNPCSNALCTSCSQGKKAQV